MILYLTANVIQFCFVRLVTEVSSIFHDEPLNPTSQTVCLFIYYFFVFMSPPPYEEYHIFSIKCPRHFKLGPAFINGVKVSVIFQFDLLLPIHRYLAAVCQGRTIFLFVPHRQTVPRSLRMIITKSYSIAHSTLQSRFVANRTETIYEQHGNK